MNKGTYFQWSEVRTELDLQNTVGICLGGGRYIELTYRKSDGEISLDVSGGQLVIEPRAANCARIKVEGAS